MWNCFIGRLISNLPETFVKSFWIISWKSFFHQKVLCVSFVFWTFIPLIICYLILHNQTTCTGILFRFEKLNIQVWWATLKPISQHFETKPNLKWKLNFTKCIFNSHANTHIWHFWKFIYRLGHVLLTFTQAPVLPVQSPPSPVFRCSCNFCVVSVSVGFWVSLDVAFLI